MSCNLSRKRAYPDQNGSCLVHPVVALEDLLAVEAGQAFGAGLGECLISRLAPIGAPELCASAGVAEEQVVLGAGEQSGRSRGRPGGRRGRRAGGRRGLSRAARSRSRAARPARRRRWPSLMSVPRPAMLVATVILPALPGLGDDRRLPARSASALSTRCDSARGGQPLADFLATPARCACRPAPARPCRSARRRARRRRPTSASIVSNMRSRQLLADARLVRRDADDRRAGRSATARRATSHAVPVMPPMIGYWRKNRWKLRRARFSLSAVTGTPSLTSIAWCSPCRHERSAITRPVNSSMIWTFSSSVDQVLLVADEAVTARPAPA